MLRKLLCLILCLLMLCTLFTGCDNVKGADATIYYPIDADPKYLDPQIISDVGAKNIIANCFEGLVSIDSEGEIVPAVAESYSVSPSELVYTFKLRQDSKWRVSTAASAILGENNTETTYKTVTADDFEFALKRALMPETKSPGATLLYSIKNAEKVANGTLSVNKLGVTAKDKFTLEITLEKADPDFLYALLDSACMPCNEEFFEATKGRYGLSTKYLLYNGPFYINNWADDTAITLRRCDGYYGSESVMPRSIYYSINNEQNTRLKKLQDDVYKVAPLTKEQKSEIENKKSYTVYSFGNSVKSFVFNCSDSALSNVNIRKAIAASLDRKVLTDMIGPLDASGIVPDSMTIGGASYRELVGDVQTFENENPSELLKKGLKKLGVKDVEVTILCTEEYENVVRSLMQSWQSAFGIYFNVFVETVDEDTLNNRVKNGEFQIALFDIAFTGNTAFSALSSFAGETPKNVSRFAGKKYTSIVEEIKLSPGIGAAAKKAKQAEQYLIDNAVIIPLYKTNTYHALGKGVSGVSFNRTGEILYFKNTLAE